MSVKIKRGIFLTLLITGAIFSYFPLGIIVDFLFKFELPSPNFNVHGGPILVAMFSPLAVIPVISFILIWYGNRISRIFGIVYATLISLYIFFLFFLSH